MQSGTIAASVEEIQAAGRSPASNITADSTQLSKIFRCVLSFGASESPSMLVWEVKIARHPKRFTFQLYTYPVRSGVETNNPTPTPHPQIIRSFDDFTKLRDDLVEFEYRKHQSPMPYIDTSYFDTVEEMEIYLNKTLSYYRYELWKTPSLLSFISDGPKDEAIISNIQISILSHDVSHL
jgi:hypothetical protein